MSPGLRALALRGIGWAALNRVALDVLRVGGRLVLARLVWPEAYGLFTLALVVVAGLRVGYPLHARVIQRQTLPPTVLATAFWSQAALGGLGTLALLAAAYPLAVLMAEPRVVPLLQVLGLALLLEGLSATPRAWLTRELAFRRLASRALVAEAVAAAVAIAAALGGAGVWSLVVQELVADVVELVLLWAVVPWRPQRHWASREFLELMRFGAPLVGMAGLEYLARQGDRFVVARGFGPGALGLYAVGARLVDAVGEGLGTVFAQVAFPAFARAQEDLPRSRRGFLEAVRFQALLTFPLLVAMMALAAPLVVLVLGRRWEGAVPFVQLMAARALLGSLLVLPRTALMGRGRPGRLVRLGFYGLLATASGWALGFPWGPLGVAAGGVAGTAVLVLLAVGMVGAELRVGFRDWARALAPALVGATAMAVGMATAAQLLGPVLLARPNLRLGVLLFVGAAAYVLPLAPWLTREVPRQLRLMREGVTPGAGRDLFERPLE